MATHEIERGEVRAIGRGGEAVVETASGIVFVPGALPGEELELRRSGSKRGAARGQLTRLLRRSAQRVDPICPHVQRCGGCPLMIADAELQRDIKLGFLREACRGLRGAEETRVEWVPSPTTLAYRRRARMSWHGSTLGYRALRSKRVSDIDACPVLMPPLADAWTAARERLTHALRGSGDIQLQLGGDGRVVVEISTGDSPPPALFEACATLNDEACISGVSLRAGDSGSAASWGDEHQVLFSQANEGINAALVQAVADLAEPEGVRVLELHSGVGNFTLELAARSPSALSAVERDPRAVSACQAALKARGLDARVSVGDANQPPKGHYDVLVLDPPRQGARALFEESKVLPGPKRVVYVSCDTATLSRDLRMATERGYRVDRMIAFDMFPQTAHLESLVRLVRA